MKGVLAVPKSDKGRWRFEIPLDRPMEEPDPNRCPVCEVPIADHFGIIGMCSLVYDSRTLMNHVLSAEVLSVSQKYMTVKIPVDLWKAIENEVADGYQEAEEE